MEDCSRRDWESLAWHESRTLMYALEGRGARGFLSQKKRSVPCES